VFGRPVQEVVRALTSTGGARRQWCQSERESFASLAAHCRAVEQHTSSFDSERRL